MRAVVQRVSEAAVEVEGRVCGAIDAGLLVYLGVAVDDAEQDVSYLADKVRHLRIFQDDQGRMNLDVGQVGGGVLVVSAFTTQADARHGRRPSLEPAARPEAAQAIYERFCATLAATGLLVERGSFGAMMAVRSTNDGPICLLLDSKRVF